MKQPNDPTLESREETGSNIEMNGGFPCAVCGRYTPHTILSEYACENVWHHGAAEVGGESYQVNQEDNFAVPECDHCKTLTIAQYRFHREEVREAPDMELGN